MSSSERPIMRHTTTLGPSSGHYKPIINHPSSFTNSIGFTLIELLVVIACIAVLLAIFIPAMRAVREQGQQAVCLSNLHQLTLAWIQYADEHDGKLVDGAAGHKYVVNKRWTLEGWMGPAFQFPEDRSALIENPDKGALWAYLGDVDIYRCPRGWVGHAATYTTVVAANNNSVAVEGTCIPGETTVELTRFGVRAGDTVLKLTRLGDIISPGPGQRAVFMDFGHTPGGGDFYVYYLQAAWMRNSTPPIHHDGGATLSMADGHAEYWKWKGRETVAGLPRKLIPVRKNLFMEVLDRADYTPQTDEGLYDLQRLQRLTWGRLGYTTKEGP
jgi:prepilin-type N-terminal cleavage/methylation domain-containing protein/prepilin-type processing-associated H-X9-DG protein